jgi:F-type H+-transporting ATPase subunit b
VENNVNELLEQLSLDQTFFVELALIAVIFFALSQLYFKPFLKLIQARHKKTIEDREAAERLVQQADSKMAEYQRLLAEERTRLKKIVEAALLEAKKEESAILAQARDEAKKITHETLESIQQQQATLKSQLQADVEALAESISERLLSRSVR